MKIEKISFDNVKHHIESIFSYRPDYKWNLLPDDVDELAKKSGTLLKWNKIKWWEFFEYGHIEVNDKEIFEVCFSCITLTDTLVIIVTDECFKDKKAYCIEPKNLEVFAALEYSKIHNMEFFQPHDYFFLFPNQKLLVMLHHSGYVMQYQSK